MSKEEMELITKIYKLHEMRKTLSTHSIYHGQYVEHIIGFNKQLKNISGKNYIEYNPDEIKNIVAEYYILKESEE